MEEDTGGTTLAHAHNSDKKKWSSRDPGGTSEKLQRQGMGIPGYTAWPCLTAPNFPWISHLSLSRERASFIPAPIGPPQLILWGREMSDSSAKDSGRRAFST